MIAKIKAGNEPGTPTYLTAAEFEESFTVVNGDRRFCINQEGVQWAKSGRLGTHWQVGNDMYVKVKDEKDDPTTYYKPEPSTVRSAGPVWGGSSCCGAPKGSCGKTGCSC